VALDDSDGEATHRSSWHSFGRVLASHHRPLVSFHIRALRVVYILATARTSVGEWMVTHWPPPPKKRFALLGALGVYLNCAEHINEVDSVLAGCFESSKVEWQQQINPLRRCDFRIVVVTRTVVLNSV